MALVSRARKAAVKTFDTELSTTVRVKLYHLGERMSRLVYSNDIAGLEAARDCFDRELTAELRAILTGPRRSRIDLRDALAHFGGVIGEQAGDIATDVASHWDEPLSDEEFLKFFDSLLLRARDHKGRLRFIVEEDLRAVHDALELCDEEALVVQTASDSARLSITEIIRNRDWIFESYGEGRETEFLRLVTDLRHSHHSAEHRNGGRPRKDQKTNMRRLGKPVSAHPKTFEILKAAQIARGDALDLVAELIASGHTLQTIRSSCKK
jgi:hypothetical protein